MLENEYLELMNELKKKHEALESREREIDKKLQFMRIDLATIFGMIRALDSCLSGIDLPTEVAGMFEILCSITFEVAAKHIFNSKKNEITSLDSNPIEISVPVHIFAESFPAEEETEPDVVLPNDSSDDNN